MEATITPDTIEVVLVTAATTDMIAEGRIRGHDLARPHVSAHT